jgi:hypothetical protein
MLGPGNPQLNITEHRVIPYWAPSDKVFYGNTNTYMISSTYKTALYD